MKRCCIIMIVPHESGTIRYAVVAELADAHGSGPCEGDFMQVQVLFPAPEKASIDLKPFLFP